MNTAEKVETTTIQTAVEPQRFTPPANVNTAMLAAMSESASIIAMIERVAMNPNVDIDKMQRLLEMRQQVEDRAAKKAFFAAFAEMQPHLPTIDRNGKIEIVKNDTVIQSTRFADIADINEAVMPVITAHGFGLSHRCGTAPDGKLMVTGILSHRDGHSEETTMVLQHDSTGSKNSVQAIGSSMTYGRRYTTIMLLNIRSRAPQDRDDDGNAADGPASALTEDQLQRLRCEIVDVGADIPLFCKHMKVERVEDIPPRDFDRALQILDVKRKRNAQGGNNERRR